MLNAILVITRARLLIARNTFLRGKAARKFAAVALLVALGFAAWGLYQLMSGAVYVFTSPEFVRLLKDANRSNPAANIPTDFRPFLDALPSAVLFGALLVLVLTSFSNLLASLYLSGDMDMLLVAPVPMRAVFVVKFFGGLLVPYVVLFVLLMPALWGYGSGVGYGVAFDVAVVVVLALFPLLPVGLGALLVVAVVRIVPARRAREIVGLLGGLIGGAWYVLSQFGRELAPRLASVGTLDTLRRLDTPLLPSAWAARALLAAGRGDWPTLLLYGGLYVAVSVGVFAACTLLAERLYYIGWSNMATQGGTVRLPSRAQRTQRQHVFSVWSLFAALPEQSRAILYKDLRVFPRDLRNVQQMIFPLVLAGFWSFQLLRSSADATSAEQFRQLWGPLGSAGITFFICLSLSNTLAGTGISREGRSFWLLKVAPISAWRLLLGKLALAYLPYPIVGTAFVVLLGVLQHNTPLEFVRSLVLVLLIGLGASCITLGMGAAFPKFNWENPNQQSSLRAGLLAPVFYVLYVVLSAGAVLGLPALGAWLLPEWTLLLALAGWLIVIALTAATVWGALSFGAARLEQVELGG